MLGKIGELSRYSVDDAEKIRLMDEAMTKGEMFAKLSQKLFKPDYKKSAEDIKFEDFAIDYDVDDESLVLRSPSVEVCQIEEDAKVCPKCGRTFPKKENVCMDCYVRLKYIAGKSDVFDIAFTPRFEVAGENHYESFIEFLSGPNLLKISNFNFTHDDYLDVLHSIKAQAFGNFDELVRTNDIDFDSLDILEKIILFTKSFVKVDYKSSGYQLGYFEDNTIFIDDRQTKSQQITTMIHELSHFLLQEILTRTVCRILDAAKNEYIESTMAYILSYSHFTQLIDEYSAHNVEGRFTLFGYQDYSSFIQIVKGIEGEMTGDEIEITKSIGNNFSISIKEILESLIDRDLREEIKDQFLEDCLDHPNYKALRMENLQILNDEGFMKAVWLVLNDGCEIAALNVEELSLIK